MFKDLKVFIRATLDEKLEVRFTDLKKTMATQESVDEIMIFLKDTVATKEDLENMKVGIDEEFIDIRYKMADMQTSINQLDTKIDQTSQYLREDIAKLSKRTDEDTKALTKDIQSLKVPVKKSKEHYY